MIRGVIKVIILSLNPQKDYGLTTLGALTTDELPVWDKFRIEKIGEIFKTCEFIIDFGNASRALSELFAKHLKGKKISDILVQ